MYAPAAGNRPHLPRSLSSVLLGVFTISATLVAWAVLTSRSTTNEIDGPLFPAGFEPERIRSVAYAVPGDGFDRIYIRPIDGGDPALIASFSSAFGLRARGFSSPIGDQLAVVSVPDTGVDAKLTMVDVATGGTIKASEPVDYLTRVAWSRESDALLAVSYGRPDDSGLVNASVLEVQAETGEATEIAAFERALDVVPVGYSLNGNPYIVVVRQSGSTLWAVRGGEAEEVAPLSAGRTRDWQLSPDGARLAFVEVLGGGDRSYAGRIMLTANGHITSLPSGSDYLGVAWRPGTESAVFGGPGGTLTVTGAGEGAYAVPFAWSPDGTTLAVSIYSRDPETGQLTQSVELVLPGEDGTRVNVADVPGAWFFGWVRNAEGAQPAAADEGLFEPGALTGEVTH